MQPGNLESCYFGKMMVKHWKISYRTSVLERLVGHLCAIHGIDVLNGIVSGEESWSLFPGSQSLR